MCLPLLPLHGADLSQRLIKSNGQGESQITSASASGIRNGGWYRKQCARETSNFFPKTENFLRISQKIRKNLRNSENISENLKYFQIF
jgi:hypothetical protein